MCGIFAIFNLKGMSIEARALTVKLLKRLRHRGPEHTGIAHYEPAKDCHHFICHERLAIVDPEAGNQPQYSIDQNFVSVLNAEIYNHKDLTGKMKGYEDKIVDADCQVVTRLFDFYNADVKKICNMLDGKFAGIVYDVKKNRYWVFRDHIGIIPCYIGRGLGGEFYVSNELKSFHDYANTLEILLPGI